MGINRSSRSRARVAAAAICVMTALLAGSASTAVAAVTDPPISLLGIDFANRPSFKYLLLGILSDQDPAATPADYVVTVDWGDGKVSGGYVEQNPYDGLLTVHGGHTYASPGLYTVTVTVNDVAGSHASATDQLVIG